MGRQLVVRTVHSIPVLFGVTVAVFLLAHVVPGDPARIILGIHATPSAVASLHHQLGLDRPLLTQYVRFVEGAAHLDFGDSLAQRTSVAGLIGSRLEVTLLLLAYSVVVALVVGVPLALVSALQRNRVADHLIRLFSMVTFAMPAFWLGLLLVLIFSLKLGWLPTSGYSSSSAVGRVRCLTLPALTIGLYLAPILLRTLRASVIDALRTEYVEAARARGLSARRVLIRHAVRNSLSATITILGAQIGFLLSGAVVVEIVFALPGLGSLLVSSAVARDFPVVEALTLVFAIVVIVINLVTDLLYAVIDPRVRL